jgi:parvulin-like peptidyl-prolyl isomerase
VIFVTDAGEVVGEDIKTDKGIHIIKVLMREPERKQTFDEVKNEAFLALRSRKEGEVQQQLLDELKEQYDVVIHQSTFAGNNESDKQ